MRVCVCVYYAYIYYIYIYIYIYTHTHTHTYINTWIHSYNVFSIGIALQGDRLYNGGHRGVDPYSISYVGDYTQLYLKNLIPPPMQAANRKKALRELKTILRELLSMFGHVTFLRLRESPVPLGGGEGGEEDRGEVGGGGTCEGFVGYSLPESASQAIFALHRRCVRVCACVCVSVFVFVCVCMYMCVCVCVYIYIYVFICKYIQIYMQIYECV
jgi:hypothetical protein